MKPYLLPLFWQVPSQAHTVWLLLLPLGAGVFAVAARAAPDTDAIVRTAAPAAINLLILFIVISPMFFIFLHSGFPPAAI
jgi:hypothetical protein